MAQKNMTFLTLYFLALCCFNDTSWANRANILTFENLPLSSNIKSSLTRSIYSNGEVKSISPKTQQLDLIVAGLHSKKCGIALSKISQYENYKNYSDVVAYSQYNDQSQMIKLGLDHMLMPFPMTLYFKIERMNAIGNYPFAFNNGFLKGLKGMIRIGEHKKKCLFFVNTHWKGPETRIPDKVFSFFITVLGEKFMEKLFHVSRTL